MKIESRIYYPQKLDFAHIWLIDIIRIAPGEGWQRGILVDVDDPLLPDDDTSHLQETPSLSGVFSFFVGGILNTILALITTLFGFGVDSLKSVVLGRTIESILSEAETKIILEWSNISCILCFA